MDIGSLFSLSSTEVLVALELFILGFIYLKLNRDTRQLNDKIDASEKRLENKIQDTSDDLHARVSANRNRLDEGIKEINNKMEKKLNEVHVRVDEIGSELKEHAVDCAEKSGIVTTKLEVLEKALDTYTDRRFENLERKTST